MNRTCLFCRIAAGEEPATVVLREPDAVVIQDIHPHAPVHVLVLPTRHVDSLATATDADQALLGRLLDVSRRVAEKLGIAKSGYRVILNTGHDGGQIVGHLHLHVLGGRPLGPKVVSD